MDELSRYIVKTDQNEILFNCNHAERDQNMLYFSVTEKVSESAHTPEESPKHWRACG